MNKIFNLYLFIAYLFVLAIASKLDQLEQIESLSHSDLDKHWSEFKLKFNKTYFNSTIEQQR